MKMLILSLLFTHLVTTSIEISNTILFNDRVVLCQVCNKPATFFETNLDKFVALCTPCKKLREALKSGSMATEACQ